LGKGENYVNIITYQKLLPHLRKYLQENNIDVSKVRFAYFGNIKGINEMQFDKTLIQIGTPEPNCVTFPFEVGLWYLGKPIISNKKRKESGGFYKHDYRYKDPRYQAHVQMIRHETEHILERLRWLLDATGKTAYLFSMHPIDFKTKKVTLNELVESIEPRAELEKELHNLKHSPLYVYLTHVQNGDTKTNVYDKVKNLVPFKNDKKLLRLIQRISLERHLRLNNRKLSITDHGYEYLKRMESTIQHTQNKIEELEYREQFSI
jgi:hypothetical protein